MTCDQVRNLILEENLSSGAGQNDSIRKHIEKCPDCASLLAKQEKLKGIIADGVEAATFTKRSAEDFSQLLAKDNNKRRHTFLAVAAVFIALLVVSLASPTIARYVPFLENFRLFNSDPGLTIGIEKAPILNESVTKNGITFTVHQIVADATRTLVIYSVEEIDVNDNDRAEDLFTWMYLDGIADDSIMQPQRGETTLTTESKYTGIASFNQGLDVETVTIVAVDLGGIPGEWAINVPLTRIESLEGRPEITYSALTTEAMDFEFTVEELTFGSTSTLLEWRIVERADADTEYQLPSVDYDFVEQQFEHLFGWRYGKPYFISGYFRERHKTYLVDKNGNKIAPLSSNSIAYRYDISGSDYFPPILARQGIKVVLEDVLLQRKQPLSLHLNKRADEWFLTAFEKEDTTVTLEQVNTDETTMVQLRYQFGRLGEMMEPYLVDENGTRYNLIEMELSIPAYNDFFTEDITPGPRIIDLFSEFHADFENYKKYQTLYFEPIPEDVENLELVFEGVFFRSDQVWEVEAQ